MRSLLQNLMLNGSDGKDPVIPQLVWIAYEKILSKASRERKRPEEVQPPAKAKTPVAYASGSVEPELAWLADHTRDNAFVRDQIVPKVMRRLVATGDKTT